MNAYDRHFPTRLEAPDFDILDILLADLAARIQLPAALHARAVERYSTIRDWIDRDGSPLQGRVQLMYPQGSMATDTTIARYSEKDEFDIDILTDLDPRVGRDPVIGLGLLYRAIRGEPGSRYYDKTTLNTRCVTVDYADMHLDLTPALRNVAAVPRECEIFHHKPGANPPDKKLVWANPFGFAEWFRRSTPVERDFANFFSERSLKMDQRRMGNVVARAPGEAVPTQAPVYRKSRAVVCLQLIKRWRNVRYDRADRRDRRRPPSILLALYVGHYAGFPAPGISLMDALIHHLELMKGRLVWWTAQPFRIHETNPIFPDDLLTDRWPKDTADMKDFIEDLTAFLRDIQDLKSGKHPIDEMRLILGRLFGERPAQAVVDDMREDLVRAARDQQMKIGKSVAGATIAAPTILKSPTALAVPRHNHFGGPSEKDD